MNNLTTYVGLDVHKSFISVAVFLPGQKKAIDSKVGTEEKSIRKLAAKLHDLVKGKVEACYEAGCFGFGLKRQLDKLGISCKVIAPSMIPIMPGDRVKTDKRDARKLGRLLKAGQLTEVSPPSQEQEAVRSVCRAREQIQKDVISWKHRISKFLLFRGLVYRDGKEWTNAHQQWLWKIQLSEPADQVVFDMYLRGLTESLCMHDEMVANIEEFAEIEPYCTAVSYLKCLRGIDTITAFSIVTELFAFFRFENPRALMAYLGVTPAEHSTSGDPKRLGMTKVGNKRIRRLLVQAAWHQTKPLRSSVRLRKRRSGQPGWVIAIAKKAESRLHRRYWALVKKNKRSVKAIGAVAREMAGFIWALLYQLELDRLEDRKAA